MATDQSEIEQDARQQVDHFADRFNEWYGYGHVILASHAAFPVSVTVDLLYQLWANFKNYTDSIGQPRTIPMLAVSDLLLSTLFRQTGKDIYEMLPDTRAYLLNKLKNDPQFGEQRIQELAAFLYQYVQQISETPEWKNFKDNQKWTAYLAVDPRLAVEKTLQVLAEQVSESRMNDSLGLTNLLENFTKENKSFGDLLANHLTRTVTNGHPKATISSPLKKLVISDDAGSGISTLNLPPHISNRFTENKVISKAIEDRINGIEIKGTSYGLFIGLSEYKAKEMTLNAPAKEAKSVAECLVKNNLIEQANCTIAVNESATREYFQSALTDILTAAKREDFIIIYFSGHAKLNATENMLVMYDYESESSLAGTITDLEFRDWTRKYALNDPTIILILDTHSGSRRWLDENNPKHISLMAGHMGEMVYEEAKGGVFSNALTSSIKNSKGKITYRSLYTSVYLIVMEATALQCPLFVVHKDSWDNYIFSNESINSIAITQKLLADCGYKIKQDGLEGPETSEAIKRFFSEHNAEQREKLRHWLELKKIIQSKESIALLILTKGVNSVVKNIFSKDQNFKIQQKRYKLDEKQPKKEPDAFPGDKEKELAKAITGAEAIVLEYSPELTKDGFKIDPYIEKLLDISFALDKEVILYNENGISLPDDLESRYRSIIWKNEYVQGVPESRLLPLHQFKEFFFKLLIVNKDAGGKVSDPFEGLINEARKTKKLLLSDQHLQVIPEEVFALTALEELYLEGNDISELPAAIGKLKKLRVLNLNGNSIKILPPEFLNLKNLQLLSLDNTNLEELPREIDKLTYLRELRVHGTRLVILPDSLARLEYLEILDARENNILNVPRKFLNHRDAGRFRNYMRDLSPGKNKPMLFLLGKNAKDTDGVADLIRKSSLLRASQWIKETGIADTFSLYKVLKRGAADNCLLYINDKDGELFKQFEDKEPRKTIRNIEQFFKAIEIPYMNLFYDGSMLKVNERSWEVIIEKDGLNSLLAQTEKASGTWENFTWEFFKNLLDGKPLLESYSTAIRELNIQSKTNSPTPPYMLYRARSFADITLTTRNAPLRPPGKKEEFKIRLEEAKDKNSLDLSEFGLSEIPPEVFKLSKLESLNISKNKIKSIPAKISRLKNLKIFDGSKTLITSLPAEFFYLTGLTKVMMDESSLEYFPPEISNLEQLNTLTFEKTLIKTLPPEISKLKELKSIGALNNKIINVPEKVLLDKKGDKLRKYFALEKKPKQKKPVIILLASKYDSLLNTPFSRTSSSFNTKGNYYISKSNMRTFTDILSLVEENINNKTLLIINDETGFLAYQFGEGTGKYYSIKQYFSSFTFPLNIIYNGPLNNQSALEDLVKEGKANSVIVQKEAPEKIEFPAVLSELMLRGGLSYKSAVLFIYKYFPRNVYSPPFVSSAKLGYDIFLNPKEFEDFYWVSEEEIKRSLPVEEIILSSKFISPSLAKRIMRELNAERTRGRSPSKRSQANALSVSKRITKKTRQKSSTISKKSPAAKKKVKKATPLRRPKKKILKKKK